jgi:polyhydroxyalkanoate synthesis regulator phasin
MGQFEVLKRTIDASMNIGQMTSARAKEIVNDLVKEGEIQREKSAKAVDALMEKSRKNSEAFATFISREVKSQVAQLNLARKDDIEKIVNKILSDAKSIVRRSTGGKKSKTVKPVGSASVTKSTSKKAPAKKSTAKKSVVKKSTAKKAPVKKSTSKKAPAKKS